MPKPQVAHRELLTRRARSRDLGIDRTRAEQRRNSRAQRLDVVGAPGPEAGAIDNSQLPVGAPAGSGGGYLIIKNSWSNCYGDAGYAYLPYDWVKAYALAAEVVGDIN